MNMNFELGCESSTLCIYLFSPFLDIFKNIMAYSNANVQQRTTYSGGSRDGSQYQKPTYSLQQPTYSHAQERQIYEEQPHYYNEQTIPVNNRPSGRVCNKSFVL